MNIRVKTADLPKKNNNNNNIKINNSDCRVETSVFLKNFIFQVEIEEFMDSTEGLNMIQDHKAMGH